MTNRRQFLVKFTMAAGAVSLLRPLNVFAGFGAPYPCNRNKLILLHTSNLMGQQKALHGSNKYSGLGGLEALSAKIDEIRNENTPVLLIDAGNMVADSGSAEQHLRFYKAISKLGYDAVIPGRSDLLKGTDHFNKMMMDSGLIFAGIKQQDAGIYNGRLPFRLLNKANLQVAVIDCGANSMRRLKNSRNAIGAINRTAGILKQQNSCILTVCILQEEYDRSIKLAQSSSDVDIFLNSYELHSIHSTKIMRNSKGNEVMLSYSGSRGAMINRVDITCNENQEKMNVSSKLVLIGINDDDYIASLKKYRLYNLG